VIGGVGLLCAALIFSPETSRPKAVTTMPWLDQSVKPGVSELTSPASPGPACDLAGLTVSLDRKGAIGGGTFGYIYDITNNSGSTCTLSGYPNVKLGQSVLSHAPNSLNLVAGPLPPQGTGEFAIVESPQSSCVPPLSSPATVAPTLDGTSASDDRIQIAPIVVDPCSTVDVTRSGLVEQNPEPDDLSVLTVTLTAASPVHAGVALDFSVSLANTTVYAVPMSSCPDYEMGISGVGILTYQLNCEGLSSIAAGARVNFDMTYDVPADAPIGQAKLGWFLLNSTRTGAGMAITITR
jgi:hypothetical protein